LPVGICARFLLLGVRKGMEMNKKQLIAVGVVASLTKQKPWKRFRDLYSYHSSKKRGGRE